MSDMNDAFNRRDLLRMIGAAAGGTALFHAMSALGYAQESDFSGAPELDGVPRGAKVIILGAGIAGLVTAHELRKAGYDVSMLEYNDHVGGRSMTLRGGDEYEELGGFKQHCRFDPGLYINPGPWRIPYHHRGYLHYAREFDVAMEAFNSLNGNAYLHNSQAFGGKPQRYRHIMADFKGHTNELLAKAIDQKGLDAGVDKETKEILLEALKAWGALDSQYRYAPETASDQRGFSQDATATHDGVPSQPIGLNDILNSGLWETISLPMSYEYGASMFEPVGGMDMLPKAMGKTLNELVTFKSKITKIIQDNKGVSVTYIERDSGKEKLATAQWCVCTLPFSILSQIEHNLNSKMSQGIVSVPYASGFKAGVQFKRRFWEEDDAIYGGITFTDLDIGQMSYPSTDFLSKGKGVILASYLFGVNAFRFSSMTPEARLQRVMESVIKIHPQAKEEFDNGVSVAWHRVPFTLGCYGLWTPETRAKYFRDVSTMDRRVVLAGEHISYIPAWQEGAILSALEAVRQLHAAATTRD